MTPGDQLGDELHAITAQVAGLLGLDLDPILRARVDTAAPRLVDELRDEETATRTAEAIMTLLHGQADPEPEWWRTPLGRLCANALADETAEAITHQRAADMLGVVRGTIATMVSRGTLDRHPDGGVLLSSVLARLATR